MHKKLYQTNKNLIVVVEILLNLSDKSKIYTVD